jgi:hypothetical protein
MRRPGAFRGAIRVTSGEIDGLRRKWRRGYGRWVGEILVWTTAPFLFRNKLVAIDGLDEQRPAGPRETKRLGDHPSSLGSGLTTQLQRLPLAATIASFSSARTRHPTPPWLSRSRR